MTSPIETNNVMERLPDDEDRAWAWLESKWLNIEAGHDPNDRDYSADEMVDAYMAGRQSLSDRIDELESVIRTTDEYNVTAINFRAGKACYADLNAAALAKDDARASLTQGGKNV